MKMIDRKTGEKKEVLSTKFVNFLYNNFLGRGLLKILCLPIVSKIGGKYMNSSLSIRRINKAIKEYNIDMSLYEEKEYTSFNDFFLRKKKNIKILDDKDIFISPSDAKLFVKKIDNDLVLDIKKSHYHLNEIVNSDIISEYKSGYALIFRLEVSDYHHYIYIDDGEREDYNFIKGILHTVQPIAYKENVFHTNSREWTILHTSNFADIIQVEVGAMMVGKITNNDKKKFNKGEEKGYFEFGGSTIILFVKENEVIIDEDILNNSLNGNETIVSCGEKIGIKYK